MGREERMGSEAAVDQVNVPVGLSSFSSCSSEVRCQSAHKIIGKWGDTEGGWEGYTLS